MGETVEGFSQAIEALSAKQRAEVERVAREWQAHPRIDLVCEGGGVLGIGLVGAYSVLEEQKYLPQNFAGTSAGAIVVALLAAGYTTDEIKKIIFDEIDIATLTDDTSWSRVPVVGKPLSIVLNYGMFRGRRFHDLMRTKLADRGVHTFRNLIYDASAQDPVYKYKLHVVVSDITAKRLLVLPRDAALIGQDPDQLSVADAVRMSMSIPLFFTPVKLPVSVHGMKHREIHRMVDGGMLSNFPVWIFDLKGEVLPPWPTFGLKFAAKTQEEPFAARLPIPLPGLVGRFLDYGWALVQTMMQAHDRLALDSEHFARTILIPTGTVESTNFVLTLDEKEFLYKSGQEAAREFLGTFSYQDYLATFRARPEVPTRREIQTAYVRVGEVGNPL